MIVERPVAPAARLEPVPGAVQLRGERGGHETPERADHAGCVGLEAHRAVAPHLNHEAGVASWAGKDPRGLGRRRHPATPSHSDR